MQKGVLVKVKCVKMKTKPLKYGNRKGDPKYCKCLTKKFITIIS